jgi:uncharacterized membrane protein YfcA
VTGFSPEFLWLAPLIALLAYTVFGLTGFGSTVIAVPLLAHLVPLTFAVPLVLLLDAVFGTWAGVRFRREARYREIAILMPFLVVGMIFGVALLVTQSERLLLGALGVFVLGYGVYCLTQPASTKPLARGWAVPLGAAGGVFSALFGTGGVVYIVYLAGRIQGKTELRATIATVLIISAALRLVIFAATGLLVQDGLFAAWVLLLPVGVLGVWIGNRLHHTLPTAGIVRLVYGLLVISGISLVARVATA